VLSLGAAGSRILDSTWNLLAADSSDTWVVAVPGDANLDGTVDLQDFGLLKDNFNKTGMTWADGEFTGDGLIDLQYFGVLKDNFNKSVPLQAVAASTGSPATGPVCAPVVPSSIGMSLAWQDPQDDDKKTDLADLILVPQLSLTNWQPEQQTSPVNI
jgi:hypothetical protein